MAGRQKPDDHTKVERSVASRQTPTTLPAGLLGLQRSAGNAAVTAWLQRSGTAPQPRSTPARDKHEHAPGCGHDLPTAAKAAGPLVPSAAHLGTSAHAGGEALGAAGLTALQRCAGNAAVSAVVNRATPGSVHADEAVAEHEDHEEPQIQRLAAHDVLRSPGQPMDPALRDEMEQRFGGEDFSSVRFHTGALAAQSATELSAQAYTSGTHIVFNKGVEHNKHVVAHELDHARKNKAGASFKSVPYGDGINVSEIDGASEVEAEATAHRVMSAPLRHTQAPGDGSENHGTAQRNARVNVARAVSPTANPTVQRALLVGDTNFTAMYKRDTKRYSDEQKQQYLRQMINQVNVGFNRARARQEFTEQEVQEFAGERDRIQYQLAKAIVDPVGFQGHHPVLQKFVGKNPDFGAKNHDIRVNDYAELARNLMGWVYAKKNRHQEKVNAQAMHRDQNLDDYLNVFLRRMYGYMNNVVPSIRMMDDNSDDRNVKLMHKELIRGVAHLKSQPLMRNGKHDPEKAGKPVGLYIAHFDGEFRAEVRGTHLDARIIERGGLLEVMKNPQKFNLREKMIAIHDLSDYFGPSRHVPPTQGKDSFEDISGHETESTAGWDGFGRKIRTDDRGQNPQFHDDGSRKVDKRGKPETHPSTRNENSGTTKVARAKRLPVWAGQSFTAARMFKMAKESGATREEIAAVGWGIFAFWRVDFDHTTEFAYHTLHEVMDIAENFGVEYDMDDPYGSYSMLNVENKIGSMSRIADDIKALYRDASDSAAWLENEMRARGMATDHEEAILHELKHVRESARMLGNDVDKTYNSMQNWPTLTSVGRSKALRAFLDRSPKWRQEIAHLNWLLSQASGR